MMGKVAGCLLLLLIYTNRFLTKLLLMFVSFSGVTLLDK